MQNKKFIERTFNTIQMRDTLYNKLANFYWLYSSKKDYEKEVAFIDRIFKKFQIPGKRILDIGCGQGDHAILLQEKGYEVTGLDVSIQQIKRAKKRANGVNFKKVDFLDFQGKRYDGVTMLWNTILYFSPTKKLTQVMNKAADLLTPGGLLLFDFSSFFNYIAKGGFQSNLKRQLTKNGYTMDLTTDNEIDMQNQVLIERTSSRISKEGKLIKKTKHNPVRLNIVSLLEMKLFLANAGLKPIAILERESLYQNNLRKKANKDSIGYLIVAKNIKNQIPSSL